MPKYIINLRDEKNSQDNFMEWSTIVDAPTTKGMSWNQFRQYYKKEYGRKGMEKLAERMNRVHAKGTSCHHDNSAADTVSFNVAGSYTEGYIEKKVDDGTAWTMTYDELLDAYCRPYYKNRV